MSAAPLARSAVTTGGRDDLWPARIRLLPGPGGSRVIIDTRVVAVSMILIGIVVLVGFYALTLGETELGLADVWSAITGTADAGTRRIVLDWRLPRIVIAVLGGAALGVSGAIFQSMTRNPLGSPDIIGFNTGAYTGALLVSLVFTSSAVSVTAGALVGGLATAIIVYALAFKGGLLGFRLIVVGIAISAMLNALNAWILVAANSEAAVSASIWGQGSLNGVRWPQVMPVLWSLILLLPVCLLLVSRLDLLELGDEYGTVLGVSPERTRLVLLGLGVGLISIITAIVGPITFVALAAPQIARRLVDAAGPQLIPSALVGGVLLLVSDVIAQRIIAPSQVPVGIVTACLGGVYLVWIMSRARRRA